MRPSHASFGERGKGHLFQGNKGQIVRGKGEQRQYWGTGNIRKLATCNLFQGNSYTPWEGLIKTGITLRRKPEVKFLDMYTIFTGIMCTVDAVTHLHQHQP